PRLSSIKVLDSSGAAQTSGPTAAVAGQPLELRVPLKPLANGVYTVAWQTVSAVDGHLALGSYAFGVGAAPPPAGSGASAQGSTSGSSQVSVLADVGRLVLYVGLVGLLGMAFVALVVSDEPPPGSLRLGVVAWLLATLGTGTVLGVQFRDAGIDPISALGTSFAGPMVFRLLPLVVSGFALGAGARRPTRLWLGLAGLAAAGAMLADVITSHAAASGFVLFNVIVQWLHVLAVGIWLGGLVALLLLVVRRGPPTDTIKRAATRFAWSATVGIAVVAVTGVLRAIVEVGTIDQLFSTTFGLLIVGKTALFVALAGLGAMNHFRHVPRADRSTHWLRRVGSTEVAIGLVVLLLSSTLVNLAPPTEVSASQLAGATPTNQPLIVQGNDAGTSVLVRLSVSPGAAGFNTFQATVTDYDSHQPITADGVSLRFAIPSRPTVGSSRLDLAPKGNGVYEATGANLSLDGAWLVTVLVARGASSVEVPLQLTTRAPQPQQVDVNVVAGLPTVYTVHLTSGRTVQVYLDPGTAGANEVHSTFFDATGTELPVQSVTMLLGAAGAPLAPLTPRRLEPGHFVADTSLGAGTYTLAVAGPAPNGDQLVAELNVVVSK
ncbi:MAG TPA: CopD family protein, partial [Candidatus Saccharimonadales bacterium]|nr:CopD family protein [Candidatus Saccharimonadales bacterium]